MSIEHLNGLAERLLLTVKTNKNSTSLERDLAAYSSQKLFQELQEDNEKKAFWINIYNSYFLLLRQRGSVKPKIYTSKMIQIAGISFSLDDIEHGILRRFRYKYSLGFLPQLFVGKHIRKLAVKQLDFRLHFALNCGAKSCPPISYYNHENIDEQLSIATLSFLDSETTISEEKKEVTVSTLFKWYWADFGKRKGVNHLIKEALNQDVSAMKLTFAPYNWDEDLSNFNEASFAASSI
ncbi:MAG: DUF547 domain-containing protein [Flavobacteriales bacterium]|nr:DUF547 domain-containing protein [Flavobacteriales bacterium]